MTGDDRLMVSAEDTIVQIELMARVARVGLSDLAAELAAMTADDETKRRVDSEIAAVRAELDAVVLAKLRELRAVAGHG
jgi:hypothetical protein